MLGHKNTPHILPLSLYLTIGGALIFLTFITVLTAQFDFGSLNIVIALLIAGVKGTLVALYFMHLKYDNKLFLILFLLGIFLLVIFITFILADTLRRGDLDTIKAGTIDQYAAIYDQDGTPIPKEQRIGMGTSVDAKVMEKVPFEILHGYGPIKEEIKVGPLDTIMALKGKPIFDTKCGTCHKLDDRYTGPPLRGVTVYRSPTFIMNQILDPKQNVEKHPEMQALLAQYYTYMTFQNVTQEDARIIVEYLRYEATRTRDDK